MQAISLKCPNCTNIVSAEMKVCDCCQKPLFFTNFSQVASMPLPQVNKAVGCYRQALAEHPEHPDLNTSVGICFLRLKMYDKALEAFERAMPDNFENADTFFLAAVCLLKGQKAFVAQRADINKALEYIGAALMIENRPTFVLLQAYIKYDYFERKYLNITPTYKECLAQANSIGLTPNDSAELFALLGVDAPQW